MNAEEIVDDLPENAEVVYLAKGTDGIQEISDYLASKTDVDTIRIISHGNEGYFVLNGQIIDGDYVTENADIFADWGDSLTEDGDIMLYGCNLAATAEGQDLVQHLADLTGADVAAATFATGGVTVPINNLEIENSDSSSYSLQSTVYSLQPKSSNWSLDYQVGVIESAQLNIDGYEYHLAAQVVTSNADDGGGAETTLREAIDAVGDGEEITFNLSSGNETIILASELTIDKSLTIDGDNIAGSGVNIIVQANANSGAANYRVFNITGGTVILENMTVSNGNTSENGAGIYNSGNLTINNSTVSGNTATYGGGIYNYGTMSLSNSTVSGNTATYGGGIYNYGTMSLSNSTVSGNTATDNGGICNYDTISLSNSIVADNNGNSDFYGSVTDDGYNIIGTSNGATWSAETQTGVNNDALKIQPLADNGGSTETMAVAVGSVAIENGYYDTTVTTTDQRGVVRNSTGQTIGAYEFVNSDPSDITLSSSTIAENSVVDTVVGTFSTTDVDAGDTHTYTLVSGSGSTDNDLFSIDDTSLIALSGFDFETQDSYSVRLRSTDVGGLCFDEVFTITVIDVNDAPVAVDDSAETDEDTAVVIDVLLNDTDAENDALTISAVVSLPINGTVISNGTDITYTPDANFYGIDSFIYRVSDGESFDTGTVTVTVTPVEYYYKTDADGGVWDENSTWTRSETEHGTYVPTAEAPTASNSASVTIISGASVTVLSDVSIDQATIDSGGQVIIATGGTLTIVDDGTSAVDLSVTGTLTESGGVLATGTDSIVLYNGVNQTIVTAEYDELQLSGSGTKTFSGTTTATGGITVNSNVTVTGSTLIASDTIIQAAADVNSATSRVFYITTNATIQNLTITNGSADKGGGIFIDTLVNDIELQILNSTISDNNATDAGGGIYTKVEYNTATLNIESSEISGNTTDGNGGGIYSTGSSMAGYNYYAYLTITYSTISGNTASYSGGGIYNGSYGTATIDNSIITGNSADSGGGIYNSNYGYLNIYNSSYIYNNTASSSGGGIYNGSYGTATIDNSIITGNSANSGGGIYNSGTITSLTNSTISGNTAYYGGGGIYNSGTITSLTNSTISGNMAYYGGGGGIFNYGTITSLTNSTISGNTAYYGGGGIYNSGTISTLTNSTISGNTAYYSGGGIYNTGTISTLTNSTISGNTAYYSGGGIYNYYGTITADSCTIANNHSDNDDSGNEEGGGIYIASGTLTVTNTIIANNYIGSGTSAPDDYFNSAGTLEDNGYNIVGYQNFDVSWTDASGFDQTTDYLYNYDMSGTGIAAPSSWNKNEVVVAGSLALASTLVDNGGSTQTLAIASGSSIAVENGNTLESADQRGVSRQSSPTIGAYEFVNSAPTDIALSIVLIVEMSSIGTTVGILSVVDVDVDVHTYTISGGADAATFDIDGSSLIITETFDFESYSDTDGDNIFEIEITVNDGIDNYSESFSITVIDVNEAPTVSLSNLVSSLEENTDTSLAIKVADIIIADDALGTNVLSLTGADAASFTIIENELFLVAGVTLDFEIKSSFDVTIAVDDTSIGATPDDTAAYALSVTDINEAPQIAFNDGTETQTYTGYRTSIDIPIYGDDTQIESINFEEEIDLEVDEYVVIEPNYGWYAGQTGGYSDRAFAEVGENVRTNDGEYAVGESTENSYIYSDHIQQAEEENPATQENLEDDNEVAWNVNDPLSLDETFDYSLINSIHAAYCTKHPLFKSDFDRTLEEFMVG
jgi:hypothetical protein